MMHLEYKKSSYLGSHILIQPEEEKDIPYLRDMVRNNLNIVNPYKAFADKMKAGGFDSVPREQVKAEAKVVNAIAELWDDQPSMNVMMLLSRALQELADMKLDD